MSVTVDEILEDGRATEVRQEALVSGWRITLVKGSQEFEGQGLTHAEALEAAVRSQAARTRKDK